MTHARNVSSVAAGRLVLLAGGVGEVGGRTAQAALVALALAVLIAAPASGQPAGDAAAPTSAPATSKAPAAAPAPAAGAAMVRFRNDTLGVTLKVDDGEWIDLAVGAYVDVAGHGETMRYRVARGYDWQFGGALDLRDTSARLVVIDAPGAHIMLTNRSDEPRDISWAGRALGRLARDETRIFGPLVVGEHELLATGARSRHLFAERLTLSPGGRVERVLDAVPVGLLVHNPAQEPVRVLVDKRDYGVLEVGGEARLLGLAPGEHELVLRGLRSGRDWRGEATLDEKGGAEAVAAAIAVVVDNDTGEDLLLPPALAGLHNGPLRKGSNVRFIVPSRPVRLRLLGAESGLRYRRDVRPEDGAEQRWTIERPTGSIRLRNATGEAARVTIAERPAFDLGLERALIVRGVPAGRVTIEVHTPASDQRFERVIQLEAGQEVAWRVRAGAATLVIDNGYAEPVEIAIDGTPRGRVGAGGSFRVADIQPGPHEVLTRTLFSHRREAMRAVVVDGRIARVRLQPPEASILVRNPGGTSVRVAVNGVGMGEVGAGRERAFLVAPGEVYVSVDDGKGRSLSWAGRLAPGQSLPMPEVIVEAPVLEVHNDGAVALELRIDERGAWRPLAVGATLMLPDLSAGEHLVELRGEALSLRRRVRLRPGTPPYQVRANLAASGADAVDAGREPAGDKPVEDKPAKDKPAEDKAVEDKPVEDGAPSADAPAPTER